MGKDPADSLKYLGVKIDSKLKLVSPIFKNFFHQMIALQNL